MKITWGIVLWFLYITLDIFVKECTPRLKSRLRAAEFDANSGDQETLDMAKRKVKNYKLCSKAILWLNNFKFWLSSILMLWVMWLICAALTIPTAPLW